LKRVWIAAFLGLALAASGQAATCTIDQVPGATLLLPYFEVDIDDPAGKDTIFTINNASATAVLTHVIVWTDMSVEALDFNVYLTGYDMQTISLGLIVRDGILPVTATAGQDPTDTISPQGPISQDINFASCNNFFPYDEPALDEEFLTGHLQPILTGGASSVYGKCGGYDYGDNVARGYVTIDTMNSCTLETPCDPNYLNYISFQNVLWGDWFLVEGGDNFAQGDAMVALEAFPVQVPQPYPFVNGTFWGRCVGGGIYGDYREPLPSILAGVFYDNAAFTGGTDYLVWRDSNAPSTPGFSCAAGPSWFPLEQRAVYVFDEEENLEEGGCTISPCPEEDIYFPIEAQRVPVAAFQSTFESGWTLLDLNTLGEYHQAWVVTMFKAEGRYAAGIAAAQPVPSCQQLFAPAP